MQASGFQIDHFNETFLWFSNNVLLLNFAKEKTSEYE